jgi:hypothetical protein
LVLVGQVANLINKELAKAKEISQKKPIETKLKNVRD